MDPYAYQTFRIIYEVTSAIIFFTLVRFMIKPYQLTKETRYLGLPLGFGFLGVTSALAAFVFYQPYLLGTGTIYVQLVLRTFAYIFLSMTYYFSRKDTDSRRLWNFTFALVIVACLTLFLFIYIPAVALPDYSLTSTVARVFNLICILYICAHTLISHIKKPDPETLWTPFGFIFLAISQYSLIIWAMDESMAAWWSALAFRWVALAIFLIISWRSFHCVKRGIK